MAEVFNVGESKTFYYTGKYQQITLSPGLYKLECWGAKGGNPTGGLGGYSYGELEILMSCTLYVYCGGIGGNNIGNLGGSAGWNGGGAGGNGYGGYVGGAGGGGASDIRIGGIQLSDRIIVAGGGGGGLTWYSLYGGYGGGLSGGNGQVYNTSFKSSGATQNTGYALGQGQSGRVGGGSRYSVEGGGGAGGGYYGGFSEQRNSDYSNNAGGGGSGYISPKLINAKTIGNINSGNGYVIITLLKKNTSVISYTYDDGIQNININPEVYYLGDTVILTPIMKQGYLWDKWTGDIESLDKVLSINIDKEGIISVHANSKPGPTQYTVKHYTQNIDIDNYTLQDTEIFEGITNDIAYPNTKIYKGFTEPEMQYITIKNDGTSILNYYYTRNKYTAIVISNGYTNKSEYYFEEKGTITYDDTLDIIYQCTGWKTNPKINVIKNGLKTYEFYMPASNVEFYILYMLRRLNSNIYKNIFPEEIFDMDFINKSLANIVVSTEDIKQNNHDLSINDFVYLDDDGLYKKAIAEESIKANVVGIVSKIAGTNVFTLMDSGKIAFEHLDYTDTTILYLSDKIPGKAVHYSEITNTVYIPVAIYIENNIIINLQQGSIGDVLAPYEEEEQSFEIYTEQELNDVVNQITNGVK